MPSPAAGKTRKDMVDQLADISNIIHLAITPAFLLVGIGTQMRVLVDRLGRITTRSRVLENQLLNGEKGTVRAANQLELEYQLKRMQLIHHAITLSTSCALLTGVVIVALFVSGAFGLELDNFIAIVFVIGMLTLIASFILFLQEIFIAIQTLPLSLQRRVSAAE
jgi:hypothetical protein